jgi:hypothetical protein
MMDELCIVSQIDPQGYLSMYFLFDFVPICTGMHGLCMAPWRDYIINLCVKLSQDIFTS